MKKLILGVGLIVCSLFLTLFFLTQKGTPVYQGNLPFEALSADVSVDFDKFGIPHIKAQNEVDAYKALGFVMAQDRLLQMDLIRRLSTGRLSEILGKKALVTDKRFRTLSFTYDSERLKSADPHITNLMESFVDGVNAYIKTGNEPFEYMLLQAKPARFEIEDAYAVLGYMGYSFALGLKADLFYEKVASKLNKEQQNNLLPYPKPMMEKVSFQDTIWWQGHHFAEELVGLFTGSNAWALSSDRVKDGKGPILASDPHVRISSPGLWYEAHLSWPGFQFYGHFVPGVPFAAMAHTDNHGWGVTISYIDDMDFVYEEVVDGKVKTKEGLRPINSITEVIKVKGEEDLNFKVDWSPRGPLVDGVLRRALKRKEGQASFLKLKDNQRLSMVWGNHSQANHVAKTLYRGLMADAVDDFEKAMSHAGSPGLNIIYVNKKENHIARYLVGTVWERKGVLARRISHGEYLSEDISNHWKTIPFKDRAHLHNPPSGVIVSANQLPEKKVGSLYPGYFHTKDRYHTIHHLLEGEKKWSLDDQKLFQTAAVNKQREGRVAKIKEALKEVTKDKSDWQKDLLPWFEKWDGISSRKTGGALLYFKTIHQFRRLAFEELSDDEFQHYCNLNDFSFTVKKRLLDNANKDKLKKAVGSAIKELKEKYGSNPSEWKWGDEHTITFPHPLGKASKLLASFYNHGPFPIDGGFHEINHFREVGCNNGLNVEAGPSTRRLVDFSNPFDSLGILPMGNSGHRKSPFLFDQWKLFQDNKYRAQIMRPLKDDERFGTLVLKAKM